MSQREGLESVATGVASASTGTVSGEARPPRVRRPVGSRGERIAPYLFLAPFLFGLVTITLGPMIASLYLSMTDYDLLQTPSFVGLENYVEIFTTDRNFPNAVRVTAVYVLVSVPLQLAFALALALALNRGLRGLAIYRAIFYIPSLVGTSVAIAVLWRRMFGDDGLINQLLGLVGIEAGSWIGNPDTALGTLVILNVWTFGAPMVIFLAALRQVPRYLYEAAALDGASRLGAFRYVTLPILTPIVFFNLILQTIGAFQAFTPAFVISGGTGGPTSSTLFYTLYLYQEGFTNFEMGYASALAWVLLLGIAIFTGVNFWLARFWVFYDD